jgi:hypothetical protein
MIALLVPVVANAGQFLDSGHGRHAEHHDRRPTQDWPRNSGDDGGQFREKSKQDQQSAARCDRIAALDFGKR